MPVADSDGRKLSSQVGLRVDDIDRDFLSLYGTLVALLRASRSETDSREALSSFLRALSILIAFATVDTRSWVVTVLETLYGRLTPDPSLIAAIVSRETFSRELLNPDILNEQQKIIVQAQRLVEAGIERAQEHSAVSGRSIQTSMSSLALSPADAYNLRRSLDSAAMNAAGHSIWLNGIGAFEKKIVVGIADPDQTALCRRLNGSIWLWDEPIVDPVSGGERMFEPFVGPDFDPKWHRCRSVTVPYFGKE